MCLMLLYKKEYLANSIITDNTLSGGAYDNRTQYIQYYHLQF